MAMTVNAMPNRQQTLLQIDQTIIDSAIDQWGWRLRAWVQAKGGHIEQLL